MSAAKTASYIKPPLVLAGRLFTDNAIALIHNTVHSYVVGQNPRPLVMGDT